MALDGGAGRGHVDPSQFVGREEAHRLVQLADEGFVGLHVDGAPLADGRGQDAMAAQLVVHLADDVAIVVRPMGQAEAGGEHAGDELDRGQMPGNGVHVGRDDDQQAAVGGLADVMDEADVVGHGLTEIVGTGVVGVDEQGRRPAVDEVEDDLVHRDVRSDGPPEALRQRVEGPELLVVALRGDDGLYAQRGGQPGGQRVGAAHMTADDGDDVAAGRVDADHGRVGVLILEAGGDGADADAHGSDEDQGVEVVPAGGDVGAVEGLALRLLTDDVGHMSAAIADGYDGCSHFSMSMGL